MGSDEAKAAERHRGGCLCGAVRYEVEGALRPVLACHCDMCQRTHGGPAYYTSAENARFRLVEDEGLDWYRASDIAARGFCRRCGASLFWKPKAADYTAIACGSLDPPSGVETVGHVFLVDKGDYYEIHDGLPQFERGSGSSLPGVTTVAPE